jgi:hypothetical protein
MRSCLGGFSVLGLSPYELYVLDRKKIKSGEMSLCYHYYSFTDPITKPQELTSKQGVQSCHKTLEGEHKPCGRTVSMHQVLADLHAHYGKPSPCDLEMNDSFSSVY